METTAEQSNKRNVHNADMSYLCCKVQKTARLICIYMLREIPADVYLHWTISSTMASRGFTLKPLYWLVWQRYEPVISLDTLTIRSTPS